MKLKRLIATMLALLLVVSLLPMTVLAEGTGETETVNDKDNVTLTQDYDKNTGNQVTIDKDVTVDLNTGTVQTNKGKVLTNEGTITTVEEGGWVGKYFDSGAINNAGNFGTIETNSGTISHNGELVEHNDGDIYINTGTVTSNNGIVVSNGEMNSPNPQLAVIGENRGIILENYGTVETNGLQTLDQNGKPVVIDGEAQYDGTIYKNYGTVETNNGTVEENYGTVETNAIDGVVNNYSEETQVARAAEDAASPEEVPDEKKGTVTQNFGTVVDKEKTYYGLSWGDNVQSLTLLNGKVEKQSTLNLNAEASKASRDGYRMTGYKAFERRNGKDETITSDTSNYTMNAPVWLQILWEKITGKPAASNATETQPTRTPVYTKLSAEQVKVGMFVRCGNMTFKIIEVTDDSIRVATVGKLSEGALADMLGFLKQHLSDAQIAKLMGAPELLEQELVAKFFGGSNEHISFYASADLFA